jgi:hypothetical protein
VGGAGWRWSALPPDAQGFPVVALGMALPHPHATDETLLFGGQEGKITRIRDSKRGFAIEFDIETRDPKLLAIDKASGVIVAEIALPDNVTGAPMTYMAGGR